jgi:hypothetical protein
MSDARLYTSLHVLIPMPASIYSFTLPTPGIFLTGISLINLIISDSSGSKYAYPSGLLISEHILANILLHAIPHDALNLVFYLILSLISSATNMLPSFLGTYFSFKYSVTSNYASSNPVIVNTGSYSNNIVLNSSDAFLYLSVFF